MTSPDPVTLSFQAMQSNAQSLAQLQAWFEANPVALIGDLHMTPDSRVTIDVQVDPDVLFGSAFAYDAIPVYVPVKVMSPLRPHPALAAVSAKSQPTNNVYFKYVHQLELPLKDWPLAAAVLVSHYLADMGSVKESFYAEKLKTHVSQWLQKHFINVHLDTLVNLHRSGLLDLTDDGKLDTNKIIEMLFESKRTQVAATLPSDNLNP